MIVPATVHAVTSNGPDAKENGAPARIGRAIQRAVGSVWVRAILTVFLLALIATLVDWGAAADQLEEGSWPLFLAGIGVLFCSQLVGAWRWYFLLEGAGLRRPLPAVIRAYLMGAFANSFLPTAFGGDLARALLLAKPGPPLVRALLSVVVDRFLALWCLIGLGWLSLAIRPGSVPTSLALALLAVTAGGLVASTLLILFSLRGGNALARRLPERVVEWARETRATLHLYRKRPRILLIGLGLGLAFQALTVTALWLVARAIDIDAPITLLAVVAPLVLVVTLIPISIAGFGLREGGMVVFLATADYSTTEATLLSLMSVVALVAASLPGAIAILFGHAYPDRGELESAEAALQGAGNVELTNEGE